MTWLEIMNILDNMPLHLLKKEAELWHYDCHGSYEVMPVHHLVNPMDDGENPEWEKGGSFYLSMQSFENEPEPRKFYVDTTMNASVQLCIQAESKEDALNKMSKLMFNTEFFDSIRDDFVFDDNELYDTWSVTAVNECFDNVDPIDVDSFID